MPPKIVVPRYRALPALLIVLAFLLSFAAMACSPRVRAGDPALPPGFLEAGVPDVELNGYVYLAQESPTLLPLTLFGSPGLAAASGYGAEWLMAFLGPTAEEFGGRVRFGQDAPARLVGQLLEQAKADQPLWHTTSGAEVRLVYGSGTWAGDARSALEQNRTVSVKSKYPDAWETMRLLPSRLPGMSTVAAGFLRNVAELAGPLLDRQGLDGAGISAALNFAQVGQVAFAVYADHPVHLPEEVTEQYLRALDVGAVVVAQAGYPGFMTSMLFDTFAGQAGLENAEVKGEKVKYRALDGDLHLMVKNYGSVLYFVVGRSRDRAESLMAGVLARQG